MNYIKNLDKEINKIKAFNILILHQKYIWLQIMSKKQFKFRDLNIQLYEENFELFRNLSVLLKNHVQVYWNICKN